MIFEFVKICTDILKIIINFSNFNNMPYIYILHSLLIDVLTISLISWIFLTYH